MDAAVAAAVGVLVARYAASVEQAKAAAESAVQGVWASTASFYDAAAVGALAAAAAEASSVGQAQVVGAAQEFVASTVSTVLGQPRVPFPRITLPALRNGAPAELVHTRTAERYKRAFATGKSEAEAQMLAFQRAGGLARTDITLRQRAAEIVLLDELGVTHYRRVLRPELSKSGSCGLCIAAADRVYKTDELMPIHPPSCKCIVMPIIGDVDPGKQLNREDLDQLYRDAGGTSANQLRLTRYKVQQHGEYGPVLTRQADAFRGPANVALEDDPARAARMLAQTVPVLEHLEDRAASGEDVSEPLEYQRELVARLRRIVGTETTP